MKIETYAKVVLAAIIPVAAAWGQAGQASAASSERESPEISAHMEDKLWQTNHMSSIRAVEGNKIYLDKRGASVYLRQLSGGKMVGQSFDIYKLIWSVKDSEGFPVKFRAVRVATAVITEEMPDLFVGMYNGRTITADELNNPHSRGYEYRVFVPETEKQLTDEEKAAAQRQEVPQAELYRIGGVVSRPVVLYKVEPEYSEEARAAKFQCTVDLSVVIDIDGNAKNIKVIRPVGLGLDAKAIACVRQWRFQPATKEGQAVPVLATVEINFRLPNEP